MTRKKGKPLTTQDTQYDEMQRKERKGKPLTFTQELGTALTKFVAHSSMETPEYKNIVRLCKKKGKVHAFANNFASEVMPAIADVLRTICSNRYLSLDKRKTLFKSLLVMCLELGGYTEEQQKIVS